ncbi:MAG: STAS domain-containing protein [Pseudomonadota bacterium]
MQLSARTTDGNLVITVETARIDAAGAIHLKDQFRDAVADTDCRVIMDIGNVEFMDSSGLGAMVAALKLLEGRKLELASLQPAVAKVFSLTRMDSVFVIHENLEAAMSDKHSDGANAA